MPPLTVPFHDHIAIQRVAKQIAEFIGLTDLTFIITAAKQKEKVGGHIDLSTKGQDVFVEVDVGMMMFPDAVAAIICHEVCHKWLQVNGIRAPIERENEILTDITSIFLGFGKIMLNGCRTEYYKYEEVSNGTRKTFTKSMNVGYLDRNQLAFVYHLVCAMRCIPVSDFMQGLNAEAISAVQICDSSWGHYYAPRFHRMETAQEAVAGFKKQVVGVQLVLADLDKHVTYTKKSFSETIDSFLSTAYKKLESLNNKAVAMAHGNEPDQALLFLRAIRMEFEINRMSNEVHSVSQETDTFLHHAKVVGRIFFLNSRSFPPPTPTMFNIVACPQDGTKLRLQENSGNIIATCPKCKCCFAYNTNTLSFPEAPINRKLTTWWLKVRNLIKRT